MIFIHRPSQHTSIHLILSHVVLHIPVTTHYYSHTSHQQDHAHFVWAEVGEITPCCLLLLFAVF